MSSSSWLAKWNRTPGSRDKATHLLLNGGALCVSDQRHSLFLNEYANAIARGDKAYVVETRTPVFRLFMDFDFKPPPPPEVIEGAIRSACAVAAYFFDADSRAVVLRKTTDAPGKVGVHLTWDALFVDAALANAFRAHLVAKLLDAAPDHDWRDIVDASVYAGSGLRMPWSAKRDAPGVYVPTQVCAPDGTMRDVRPAPTTAPAIREWVRWTSIRAVDATMTRSCIVTAASPDPTGAGASTSSSTAATTSESLVCGKLGEITIIKGAEARRAMGAKSVWGSYGGLAMTCRVSAWVDAENKIV